MVSKLWPFSKKKILEKSLGLLITCQKNDEVMNCHFSEKLNFGFRGKFTEVNDTKTKQWSAWVCCFYLNFYGRKDKSE